VKKALFLATPLRIRGSSPGPRHLFSTVGGQPRPLLHVVRALDDQDNFYQDVSTTTTTHQCRTRTVARRRLHLADSPVVDNGLPTTT